ncbi:hypothetical protein JOH52_006867 [Sinorhizobium meliloti]|nr:hypothetical protein [Sinorhizobium meliloti]
MSAAANDGAANRKQEIATDLMETRFIGDRVFRSAPPS